MTSRNPSVNNTRIINCWEAIQSYIYLIIYLFIYLQMYQFNDEVI